MQNGFKHCKKDKNHNEIRDEFKRLGWSVFETYQLSGFVDQVVGKFNVTLLVEVKQEGKPLTEAQQKFADNWRGTAPVAIRSVEDVRELDTDIMQRAKGWLG